MSQLRRIPIAATLLACAALAGPTAACDPTAPDGWAERREDLDRNRELWESRAIDSYATVYAVSCGECIQLGPVVVRVRNGVVVDAERLSDGEPVPEEHLPSIRTVDGLFDLIASAIDDRVDLFEARYEAALGYPTSVSITHDTEALDGGVTIHIHNLVPIQEG